MTPGFPIVFIGLLAGIFVSPGKAATITLNAVHSGWYAEDGQSNGRSSNIAQGDHSGSVLRNWLGFDLSSVEGNITSAVLEVGSNLNNASGQAVQWWEVITPYAGLGINSKNVYQDLGSGTLFAAGFHTAGVVNSFTFNADGVAALNAASSYWAVGGSNQGGAAFGLSNGVETGDHLRLVLTTGASSGPTIPVSDSGATLGLLGGAVIILGAVKRRK